MLAPVEGPRGLCREPRGTDAGAAGLDGRDSAADDVYPGIRCATIRRGDRAERLWRVSLECEGCPSRGERRVCRSVTSFRGGSQSRTRNPEVTARDSQMFNRTSEFPLRASRNDRMIDLHRFVVCAVAVALGGGDVAVLVIVVELWRRWRLLRLFAG